MTFNDRPLLPAGVETARGWTMRLRLRPRLIPAMAMAAVLLVGLASNIAALVAPGDKAMSSHYSWHDIAAGKPTADIAHFLLHHNPFAASLVTVDRTIAWNVVGDLGTRVRRGCGNWLFLTDELEIHKDRIASLDRHAKIVEAAAAFLRRRNIDLAVAEVPDKSRVEASELCGIDRSPVLAPRYNAFVSRLRGAGMRVVDLLQPLTALSGEGYYRTDTHWNQRGAKAAAGAIAAALRKWGWAPTQHAEFHVTTGPVHERVGDLIRLAGLDDVPWPLRPRGDMVATTRIEQSAAAGTGILDEVAAPQLVEIGTSFSRRAEFTGFLGMALGAPVANMAKDGGGLTAAAIAYFGNPAFTKTPPRVIVWEIPERVLEQPVAASDEAWAARLNGGS